MRYFLALPLLAALALPLTGCSERDHDEDDHCNEPAPAGTMGKLAAGRWFFAGQDNGVETYRTDRNSGRGPHYYDFAADGTITVTVPGPTDGGVSTAGTWNQQGDDIHIMLPQSTITSTHLTWRLQALSATELKVTVR